MIIWFSDKKDKKIGLSMGKRVTDEVGNINSRVIHEYQPIVKNAVEVAKIAQKLRLGLPNNFGSYVSTINKFPNYSAMDKIISMTRATTKSLPTNMNMKPNISKLISPVVNQLTSVSKMIGITNSSMISSLASITKISDKVSFNSSLLTEFSKPFFDHYHQYKVRQQFALENRVIVPSDFKVNEDTDIKEYWVWLKSREKDLYSQVEYFGDYWSGMLISVESMDYRLLMPFLFSYVESLLRDILSMGNREKVKVSNYNSKNLDIDSLREQDPYLSMQFFMADLITQIVTSLFQSFRPDKDKTYRNSILHGISSPEVWKREAYQLTLLAIMMLQTIKDELQSNLTR